jgi:hypothetical protein
MKSNSPKKFIFSVEKRHNIKSDNTFKNPENVGKSITTSDVSKGAHDSNLNISTKEKKKKRIRKIPPNGSLGRWKSDEHQRFIEAVFEHGLNWKKVININLINFVFFKNRLKSMLVQEVQFKFDHIAKNLSPNYATIIIFH